jgi:hypothetical protein
VIDVHDIRHGYNLADLNMIARAAVQRGARSGVVPMSELYDAAWSAIAEHLVTAGSRPLAYELIGAGMRAIADESRASEQAHGWDPQARSIRPSFATFWKDLTAAAGTPEDRIIDQATLWQIWQRLTDTQRGALLALASFEDYQTAAASLGVSYGTFHERVRAARKAFLALWHEGEQPSAVWSADRRRWRDGKPVQHRRLRDRAARAAWKTAACATELDTLREAS